MSPAPTRTATEFLAVDSLESLDKTKNENARSRMLALTAVLKIASHSAEAEVERISGTT
jgi:hypothetical protein